MFQPTFPRALYSLGWTWFPAGKLFIGIPVSSRTGTHLYFHHSSAKGLPVSLQSENHLNWSSVRTWRAAWKAHEGKHLCDIFSTNCNAKQRVLDHYVLRHKTSITHVVPLLLPQTTYMNSQHKDTHHWRLSSQFSKHEAARHIVTLTRIWYKSIGGLHSMGASTVHRGFSNVFSRRTTLLELNFFIRKAFL